MAPYKFNSIFLCYLTKKHKILGYFTKNTITQSKSFSPIKRKGKIAKWKN